jgi:hypothetical protein
MNAMLALLKILVLLNIFLSESNANAFTSLSPVAGSQVQENHFKQFETVNGINTSYTFEAVKGVNAKQFEAVSGINTSYTFEAVNGANAKQFVAVNGINTSYTFEAVNGVNAKQFEAVNGINTSYTFEAINSVNVDASQPTVAKTSERDKISKGAQNPSSMLIVRCNTASLWDSSRNMTSLQDSSRNMASLKDIGCGKNTSKRQSILPFHNKLIELLNNHIQAQLIVDSKISSLKCSSGLYGNTSLVGLSGSSLVGLSGISGLVG